MEIVSNGSKWYGQPLDTIDDLLHVLATEPLDPRFEKFGNFIIREPQDCSTDETLAPFGVFGNFYRLSHVFNIRGTLDELRPVMHAIRQNQKTAAYRAAKAERSQP